jgi:hypothetical protein
VRQVRLAKGVVRPGADKPSGQGHTWSGFVGHAPTLARIGSDRSMNTGAQGPALAECRRTVWVCAILDWVTDPDLGRVRDAATRFRYAFEQGGLEFDGVSDFPLGACGTASDLLGQYLVDSGLGEWTYRSGVLPDSGNTHAWLERDGVLVDITADQFSDADSPVIVTTDSEWHARLTRMAGSYVARLDHYDETDEEIASAIRADYETLKHRADRALG